MTSGQKNPTENIWNFNHYTRNAVVQRVQMEEPLRSLTSLELEQPFGKMTTFSPKCRWASMPLVKLLVEYFKPHLQTIKCLARFHFLVIVFKMKKLIHTGYLNDFQFSK